MLICEWGNEVSSVPHILTWHSVFSFFGKLVGHFPVVKWLRVAAVFIKRRAADMMKGWDYKVIDILLTTIIKEVVMRKPVWGKWYVCSPELNIWFDANSLATRCITGAWWSCWLWNERDKLHINLAELDTVLKGGSEHNVDVEGIFTLTLLVCSNGSWTPLRERLGCAPKWQVRCWSGSDLMCSQAWSRNMNYR